MRINRRFLYAGVFLVALGAVLVAADLQTLDLRAIQEALRLWPLAVVLVGIAIVIRRTPAAVPAGLLAAGLPGLVLGGAIAVGPRFITECGDLAAVAPAPDVRQGTFDGPASVEIHASCGTITIGTAAGSAWQLSAANTKGRSAAIEATNRSLTIEDSDDGRWPSFDAGRDDWQLTLPTSSIRHLNLASNANDGRVDLAGAELDAFELSVNASRLRLDLTGASVRELTGKVNFGAVSIELPAGADLIGNLRVNASELRLCAPAGVGLRVSGRGFAAGFDADGADRNDLNTTYQTPDYATASHHIDLTVNASFGSVEINPIGGCK